MARVITRLRESLAAGDVYAALQSYRTLVIRRIEAVTVPANDGLDAACQLILDGCTALYDAGGVAESSTAGSGLSVPGKLARAPIAETSDLAEMAVKSLLLPKKVPFTAYSLAFIEALAATIPNDRVAAAPSFHAALTKLTFLKNAWKWADAAVTASQKPGMDLESPDALVVQQLKARLALLVARAGVAAAACGFACIQASKTHGSTVIAAPEEAMSKLIGDIIRFYALSGDAACPDTSEIASWPLVAHESDAPWKALHAPDGALSPYPTTPSVESFTAETVQARGNPMHEFARWIVGIAMKSYGFELDMFLARPVLHLACLQNLRDANGFRDAFLVLCAEQPGLEASYLSTPLCNFIRFLLLTLERDAAPLFNVLREKYAKAIDEDPSFGPMLQAIGLRYFKITPPKTMMENMMSMFTGGDAGALGQHY